MKAPDILEFIRNALTADATTLQRLEPVLAQARQTYGGDRVYVRAPEPVDRLLGITDQQQGTVGIIVCGSIDTVEEAVLQGRCVLEFVNQCYGVLRQNPRAQHSAVLACQSTVQALQHIREAKRPGLALEELHALLNLGGGVQAYSNMEAGQLRKG